MDVDHQIRLWMVDYASTQVLQNFIRLRDEPEAATSVAVLDTLTDASFDSILAGALASQTLPEWLIHGTQRRMYLAKFAWSLQYAFSGRLSEEGNVKRLPRTHSIQSALHFWELACNTMDDPQSYSETTVQIKSQLLLSVLTYTKDHATFHSLLDEHFPEEKLVGPLEELARAARRSLILLAEAHSEQGGGAMSYTDEVRIWRSANNPVKFLASMRGLLKNNFDNKSILVDLAEKTEYTYPQKKHFSELELSKNLLEILRGKFFENNPPLTQKHTTRGWNEPATAAVEEAVATPVRTTRTSRTSKRATSVLSERGGMSPKSSPLVPATQHSVDDPKQSRRRLRSPGVKKSKGRAAEVANALLSRSTALERTGDDPLDEIAIASSSTFDKANISQNQHEEVAPEKKRSLLSAHDSGVEESFTSDDNDDTKASIPKTQPSPVRKNAAIRKKSVRRKNPRNFWTSTEIESLKAGVNQHGPGRWMDILHDVRSSFQDSRTSVDLKDKWRNLELKGEV